MKTISLPLAMSLLIVVCILGIIIGYGFSAEYRFNTTGTAHVSLGQPDRWVDQRYLRAMIAHHRGAILLAEQAKKQSTRPEVLSLSSEILTSEPLLIAELQNWNKTWYGDIKPVLDPAPVNLGESGNSFDLRFLNALINHHQEGITMTQEIRSKSTRTEVLDNADSVEAFLKDSLIKLYAMRQNWYQVVPPSDGLVSSSVSARVKLEELQ